MCGIVQFQPMPRASPAFVHTQRSFSPVDRDGYLAVSVCGTFLLLLLLSSFVWLGEIRQCSS